MQRNMLSREPTVFYLIRHAPLENVRGVYVPTDASITADIDAASLQAIRNIANEETLWVSSPFVRCVQTLAVVDAGAKPLIVDALAEQDFGAWHGRSYDAVWQETLHWPTWETPALLVPPEGESFADMVVRVKQALASLAVQYNGRTLAVMTHAGVIRAALHHACEILLDAVLALEVPYLSVRRIVIDAQGAWSASH